MPTPCSYSCQREWGKCCHSYTTSYVKSPTCYRCGSQFISFLGDSKILAACQFCLTDCLGLIRNLLLNILVAQLCLILCNTMDYSPPGSSVHGILQARLLEWVAIPFSRGIFLTQRSNLGILHCRPILYQLNYQGSPKSVLDTT